MSREVLVGVCGGVAGFKAAALVSQLVQASYDVQVILTESASQFVGSATFSALTGRPVAERLFDARFPLGAHIELAQRADLMLVLPATANILAKAAHGVSDDLLSTAYLAFDRPVFMAPAMNGQMWSQPAVQRNVKQLVEDGVTMIGPGDGWLSCRQQGAGRMAEPSEILDVVVNAMPLE
jgi:phosphopantothenoylcysteine decarboxylase/phosphopantothenate--cysteine ligase